MFEKERREAMNIPDATLAKVRETGNYTPAAGELCGNRNGTYTCQFEHGADTRHAGMHYAYYISGGRAYVAEWVERYSQISTRKAPVPARVKR